MKTAITSKNAAALAKYAALAGHTPTEFLNRYLADYMVTFEDPTSGEPTCSAFVKYLMTR
jgi:hypothetical protein